MGIFNRTKQDLESREYQDLNLEISKLSRRITNLELANEKLELVVHSLRGKFYKEKALQEEEEEEEEPQQTKGINIHTGRYM